VLALASFGRSRRVAVSADPVALAVVKGTFEPPRAGDVLRDSRDREQHWQAVDAMDAAYAVPNLAGGWLYVPVDSPDERVAMLHAAGHSMVYVNGEPRPGDPYEARFLHVPVQLKSGRNDLLFAVARERVRVDVSPATREVSINLADVTLPDFVSGAPDRMPMSVPIVNATTRPVRPFISLGEGKPFRARTVPPLSVRKQQIDVLYDGRTAPVVNATLLLRNEDDSARQTAQFECRRREPGSTVKRTFVSDIDESVQYYTIVPAQSAPARLRDKPGLVLSLHGAAVEATSQADAYSSKRWCHIVCPTNRRPYGFDWEDWGRIDALEVLDRAEAILDVDPTRVYLTGHSMGGHGTWQIGSLFPDRFAAIGPSAGWLSFASYTRGASTTGASTAPASKPLQPADLFRRAAATSDTQSLMPNLAPRGVYVLHGIDDDNVPVTEARSAVKLLEAFHRDFNSFEQPNAGHWWDVSDEPGADCVDWPAMFDFFARRRLPQADEVREFRFRTFNPGVSSRCHWLTIDQQTRPMMLSEVSVRFDPHKVRFSGTTTNVARLMIDCSNLHVRGRVKIELDGATVETEPTRRRVWLARDGEAWRAVDAPPPGEKTAVRTGPFKMAFNNRMMFVYGTGGTPEENAATYAKARYDAETWWYRANGSVDVVPDAEFDPQRETGRNVILYGNADTNRAWNLVLDDSCPIKLRRGMVDVGLRAFYGENLACLFIRPRAGDSKSLVGVVGATGVIGIRLTSRLPYFASGVGYPDWCVMDTSVLESGLSAVRGAGFFANDWSLSREDTAWIN
jgi:poly(3-hydroxybutyrate) depolymerase